MIKISLFIHFPLESQQSLSRGRPTLTKPPIGTELPSSCLPRCSGYTYRLYHEELSDKDEKVNQFDLYFYFTSSYVEVWHEFESYSAFALFSDVGGTMGLLLGMSLLTIVEMIVDVIERIVAKAKQWNKH